MKLGFTERCRSQQARVASHLRRMPVRFLPHETRKGYYAVPAALALLAGCTLEQPRGVVRVAYECDQGRSFTARYERDGQVILELDGEERMLPEVSAIDGTRYDDGSHELRLQGRNATLHGPALTYSNCVARDWQEAEPR